MAKSHVLKVTTADGVSERRVDGIERLLLASGGTLESWKLTEIGTVTVNAGGVMFFGDAEGKGWFRTLGRAARIDVGEERFPVSGLTALELKPIPKPVEPIRPYADGTWKVHFRSGESELLYGVERFEDVSGYVFDAGNVAVPAEEPGNGVARREKAVPR